MNASVKKSQQRVKLIDSLPYICMYWLVHSIERNSFNQKQMPFAHMYSDHCFLFPFSLYLLSENIENSFLFHSTVELHQNISMNDLIRIKMCVHCNGIKLNTAKSKGFKKMFPNSIYNSGNGFSFFVSILYVSICI